MFFTETKFGSSKHSFNCSLSLNERTVIWWNSKQHSNWREALKEASKKLNITNMKIRIWKTWHKLGWMNKQVNVFNRCFFWNFVSCYQFLTLLEIILWVTFLFRSMILTLFRMGIFGDDHRWGGRPTSLKSVTHILKWWNLAVVPYLKKIQKYMNHVTHPVSSADISFFSLEISKFFYIKKCRHRLHFAT